MHDTLSHYASPYYDPKKKLTSTTSELRSSKAEKLEHL